MSSFMRLWENITHNKTESDAIKAIRVGLNINDNFWDDFLLVLNNVNAAAELFSVRPEQISHWSTSIRRYLDQVRNKPEENPSKTTVLKSN